MQWISMILPAFLSIIITEKIKKKEFTWLQTFKRLGFYIIINNLLSLMVCYYFFGIKTPLYQNFTSDLFFIKYSILILCVSLLLPVFSIILGPFASISMEPKDKKGHIESEKIHENK